MKKIFLIFLTVFLNGALFSCSPDSVSEDETMLELKATEGEDGEIDEDPDEEFNE